MDVMGEPDLKGFLFLTDNLGWYLRLRNSGKKTLDEILRLREEFLLNKENTPKIKEPKRINHKISLPIELHDIPMEKIILFKNGFPNINKNVKRFAKKYGSLGAIDGYTYDMLLKTKGIGKTVIGACWGWFSDLYISNISDIVEYLSDSKPNIELTDIHYSYNVGHFFDKHKITSYDELSRLDNIPKGSLSLENKLALLELRTLYEDIDGNLRTKTNNQTKKMNLYSFIDSYYDSLDTKSQEIMQRRWGNETLVTLKEVGEFYGFTRERARQILQKLMNDFIDEYFYEFDKSFNYFARLFIEKRSFIDNKDLISSHQYDSQLNKNFYNNFMNSIFHPIPFFKTNEPTEDANFRRFKVIKETKIKLSKKSKLHVSKHLKIYDLNDQILLMKNALNPYGLIDILDDHFVLNAYKTSEWEDNYNKLKIFIDEYKRIPRSDKRIAETPKIELELGKWYRSLILKFRNGSLQKDRLKRLRRLIPDFGRKQRSTKVSWMDTYKEYINFKKKHQREPKQHREKQFENRLAMWVLQNKQRFHRTAKIQNSPLSDKQLKLLNKIKFDFSYTDTSGNNKKFWDEKFNQLKYIAPPNFSKKEIGEVLTRWLYQQKSLLNRGKLSNRRKTKLESIGVNLSISHRKEIWLDNFNEYINSNKIKSDSQIYVWFNRQKIRFRKNTIQRDQLIKLIEYDLLPPIDDLESDWDSYYHSANYFFSSNKTILKVIMEKPNKLYTWLIYNYCMFKLGKLNDVRMLKFEKLEIKESIFDQ